MVNNSEADVHTKGSCVEPSVKREDLQRGWIGLGTALDWIAQRGQPLSRHLYPAREDTANETFVAAMADLPSEFAESLVRGQFEDGPLTLVPIPSGIWRLTATSDANDADLPYRLIGTDEGDPCEGAILGMHVAGYRKVQIQSAFILDRWPEHTPAIEPVPTRATSRADVRRLVESMIAKTPQELAPLSQDEMENLIRTMKPAAPRDMVRELYRAHYPNLKRGPKGQRDPERKAQLEKFRGELIAAKLRN